MNQCELAKRHEIRKSMPEPHTCCHAARQHLCPRKADGVWQWYLMGRERGAIGTRRAFPHDILINYCPWCGEKLPDCGRLVVTEANNKQ